MAKQASTTTPFIINQHLISILRKPKNMNLLILIQHESATHENEPKGEVVPMRGSSSNMRIQRTKANEREYLEQGKTDVMTYTAFL